MYRPDPSAATIASPVLRECRPSWLTAALINPKIKIIPSDSAARNVLRVIVAEIAETEFFDACAEHARRERSISRRATTTRIQGTYSHHSAGASRLDRLCVRLAGKHVTPSNEISAGVVDELSGFESLDVQRSN